MTETLYRSFKIIVQQIPGGFSYDIYKGPPGFRQYLLAGFSHTEANEEALVTRLRMRCNSL